MINVLPHFSSAFSMHCACASVKTCSGRDQLPDWVCYVMAFFFLYESKNSRGHLLMTGALLIDYSEEPICLVFFHFVEVIDYSAQSHKPRITHNTTSLDYLVLVHACL